MRPILTLLLMVILAGVCPATVVAWDDDSSDLPYFLKDRGPGIPTSMFGTYVLPGELLVYPFYEHYRDGNAEYAPEEFGYGLDQDLRGDYEADEYLIFLSYGLTRSLAVEFEAAFISAELERSPDDPTAMPQEYTETGLGDVEGQIRWLWAQETETRPGFFSYGEVVFPLQKDRQLIGTTDWEFKLGTGLMRGFRWGTTTVRAAVEYVAEESKLEVGEMAVEYLKRVSPLLTVYTGVEGTFDEVSLIPELQLHVSNALFFKMNAGIGLTSKATDFAPEMGVVFRF